MSYLRYTLELAFKEPLPVQLKNRLKAWELATKAILPDAVIINEGQENEEMTVKAAYHICHHDTGDTCEPEIKLGV